MGLNANALASFLQPVKSVNEFIADYDAVDAGKQRNALLQMQVQKAQQGMADQQAVRNALSQHGATEQGANALMQLGAFEQAQAIQQQVAARQKQAEEQQRRQRVSSYMDSINPASGVARPFDPSAMLATGAPAAEVEKVRDILAPRLMVATPGSQGRDPNTGELKFSVPTAARPTPLQAAQEYYDSLPDGDPRKAAAGAVIRKQALMPKYAGGGGVSVGGGGGGSGGAVSPGGGGMGGGGGLPATGAAPAATLAQQLGVPVADSDPAAAIKGKTQADMFRSKLYSSAGKRIDEISEAASSAAAMANDAARLLELQKGVKLAQGPIGGKLPALFADAQEMDAITAKITPQMRQPGSGATSDFDAKMFKSSTVSREKDDAANEAIALGIQGQAMRLGEQAQFMRDYLSANGHIDGADRAWKRYIDANPIFDPRSPGVPVLNKARRSYQEFFRAKPAAPTPPAAGGGFSDAEKEARYQAWKASQGAK